MIDPSSIVSSIITSPIQQENRTEFDRVTNFLNGAGIVISKIKNEIEALKNKFASMIEIITQYPDQISVLEKQLYDVQCQSFLHAVFMYLGFKDSNGTPYIGAWLPTALTTDISLTIKLPNSTITSTLLTLDNMAIDIENWIMYVGTHTITASKSATLEQEFDTLVTETPENYFSRAEFIAGVGGEVEKLILFNSQVCKLEQQINYGLRYISELKNIKLYG